MSTICFPPKRRQQSEPRIRLLLGYAVIYILLALAPFDKSHGAIPTPISGSSACLESAASLEPVGLIVECNYQPDEKGQFFYVYAVMDIGTMNEDAAWLNILHSTHKQNQAVSTKSSAAGALFVKSSKRLLISMSSIQICMRKTQKKDIDACLLKFTQNMTPR